MAREFWLRETADQVDLWSTRPLPLEPKGWLVEMRTDLRAALGRLKPEGPVHASYCAADGRTVIDAENVLFYNPGNAYVGHLITRGVRFERGYSMPVAPASADLPTGVPVHHARYGTSSTRWAMWRSGDVFANVADVAVDRLNTPGPVWAAIRGQAEPPASTGQPRPFTVTVRLRSPDRPLNVDRLKWLLDGIIAAYHAHIGATDEVAVRMAARGLAEPAWIRDQLVDSRWSALGHRALVRPTASYVAWNPADDRCVAAEVVVDRQAGREPARWRLSATLAEAIPYEPVS